MRDLCCFTFTLIIDLVSLLSLSIIITTNWLPFFGFGSDLSLPMTTNPKEPAVGKLPAGSDD